MKPLYSARYNIVPDYSDESGHKKKENPYQPIVASSLKASFTAKPNDSFYELLKNIIKSLITN